MANPVSPFFGLELLNDTVKSLGNQPVSSGYTPEAQRLPILPSELGAGAPTSMGEPTPTEAPSLTEAARQLAPGGQVHFVGRQMLPVKAHAARVNGEGDLVPGPRIYVS